MTCCFPGTTVAPVEADDATCIIHSSGGPAKRPATNGAIGPMGGVPQAFPVLTEEGLKLVPCHNPDHVIG